MLAALQFVKCEPLIGTRNKEIIGFDGNEIAQQKFHCLKILFFIGCIFWYFIYKYFIGCKDDDCKIELFHNNAPKNERLCKRL